MEVENSLAPSEPPFEDPSTVLHEAPAVEEENYLEPGEIKSEDKMDDISKSDPSVPTPGKATAPAPKLIRKRNLNQSDQDSDNDDDENADEIEQAFKTAEKEQRESLVSFLVQNKVDSKAAQDYKINLRIIKGKSKSRNSMSPEGKKDGPRFRVSYTAPDKSLLETMRDVLTDIQQRKSRNQHESKSKATSTFGGMSREEVHEVEKKRLAEVQAPVRIDNIKVLNFGQVDTRSGFSSCAQIYPVGYKCEQTVTGSTLHKGVFKQEVICEIRELDGFPEFRITTKSTGTTLLASSEESAWKQFYPGNIDKDSRLSFFNLNIELLLEGLDGALLCEDYKFHFERGYGKEYTSDKDAFGAKIAFIKKMERERRNLERQRNRSLTKEEQERLAELARRKEEEEKKMAKTMQQLQKERKDQSREEFKKSREREKGEEAERSKKVKLQERADERAKKEENKKENKSKQVAKKELSSDLRKVRNEVNALVLHAFDEEEKENDVVLQLVADAHIDLLRTENPLPIKAETIEQLVYEELQPLPSTSSVAGRTEKVCWDDFFAVANYVNVFKSLLGIDHTLSFDRLLSALSLHSQDFVEAVNAVNDVTVAEPAAENAMDVEESAKTVSAPSLDTNALEAELERIQLNLLRVLLPSVHSVLDLDQKETADGAKRDKRQVGARLPLNQLTWADLVRAVLLQYLFSEMGRSKDDALHVIRGSKASNYRIAKNVARNIRYKWYIRNKLPARKGEPQVVRGERFADGEDFVALMHSLREAGDKSQLLSLPAESVEDARRRNLQRGKTRPADSSFASEAELVDELSKAADSAATPEVYRRCCKVLLRILKIPAAQQFLWEVDQDASPDYYSAVARPLMFSHVAQNLLSRAYDESESEDGAPVDEARVAREFYADIKQVPLNCIAFSSELPTIVAAAHKLLLAIYRHTERWVTSAQRPVVEQCDEKCCLLTHDKIVHQKTLAIKCGKCAGSFNLDSVENLFLGRTPQQQPPQSEREKEFEDLADFFVAPTDDLVNQATEEWHCPFCLQEDFSLLQSFAEESTLDALLSRAFFVDEWGPSAALPWVFNPVHSNVLERFARKESYLLLVVDALKIVTSAQSSPYAVSGDATSPDNALPWSLAERLAVLKALFVVLQSSDAGLQTIQKINDDGEKLVKYCSKTSFREAEFMALVREICGDDGVVFCRKLLDGFDSGANGGANGVGGACGAEYGDNYIEGRCMVCNVSTVGDEDDEDDEPDKVLICDGCNGEAHLHCLGLSSVPYASWFCAQCSMRQSRRDKKSSSDAVQLESLEHHRDRDAEDELVARTVERKMNGLDPFREGDLSGHTCAYCGLHELELCSPMVYGQSRAEHEQWVQLCNKTPLAHGVLGEETMGTTVNFLFRGERIAAPKVQYPYFPAVGSADGAAMQRCLEQTEIAPTIVHQLCALHMFHARVNRSKHETRRRRRAFARVVEGMGGVFLFPLGQDAFGNEYWHFPFSSDLFVARNARADAERDEFNRILQQRAQSGAAAPAQAQEKLWLRVRETEHIRKLVQLLDAQQSSDKEKSKAAQALRANIVNTVLAKRLVQFDVARSLSAKSETATAAEPVAAAEEQDKAENDKARRSNDQPVEMRLNTAKGLEIPEHATIDSELVFDASALEEDADKEHDACEPFFSLSTKKFYAIALMNASGAMVKMGKAKPAEARTVIYTIRREGVPSALLEAELSEAWEDHLYYFSALAFKRSGVYTLSFHVQNSPNAPPIKPLSFKIVVETRAYRCGVRAALDQLHAVKFLHSDNRQVVSARKELLHIAQSAADEFSAVRAALLFVYLALPSGALPSEPSSASNARGRPSNESLLLDGLLEPGGWNGVLEQTWRGAVLSAASPSALMECLLVLEFYIHKSRLATSQGKLWSALPSPHFAIRCATLAAVAMRVYCLDKVLLFAKVTVPAREKRAARSAATHETPAQSSRSARAAGGASGSSRSAAAEAKKRMQSYREDDDEEEAEEEGEDDNGEEDDENGESEGERDENDSDDASNARGRTRRRASKRNSSSSAGRTSRRKSSRRYAEDDDNDEDEDSEEDEEDHHALRRSSRATASHARYTETSENEEEDEENGPAPATRVSKRRHAYDDDDEEADFDDGNAAKKAKNTPKKSADQQFDDYVDGLPALVDKCSEEIAEYPQAFAQLPADELDNNIRFLSVLRRLREDARTFLFWEPVDPSVPGYRDVIRSPMDLGTISSRVRNNFYHGQSPKFAADLMLVWSNCKTFNVKGSVLHEYATEFEALSERLVSEWVDSPDRAPNPDISEDVEVN